MWRAAGVVLVASACGRVGFGDLAPGGDAATGDARAASDASDDRGGSSAAIAYVAPFVQLGDSAGDTFAAHAMGSGDVVVFQVVCKGPSSAPNLNVTDDGSYAFTQIGASGSAGDQLWQQVFEAVAPDTQVINIMISWPSTCTGRNVTGDEFASVDATAPIDAVALTTACSADVTTAHAGDALWFACAVTGGLVEGLGSGYTLGANDGVGDETEYRLTSDPAGTHEAASMTANASPYAGVMVALAPAAM